MFYSDRHGRQLGEAIANKCEDLDNSLLMSAPVAERVRAPVHKFGAINLCGVMEWLML